MIEETVSSLSAGISQVLARFDGARLAILFGSRAKGNFESTSDVDLVIDADEVHMGELAARLSERLGHEVDVILLRDATIPLLRELIEHGKVVYEAKPGDGALWRSRALVQLEIDGPWYDRMRDAWLSAVATRGFSGQ